MDAGQDLFFISPIYAYRNTVVTPTRSAVAISIPPSHTKNCETPSRINPNLIAICLEEMNRAFFEARAARWIEETGWYSSISSITRHPQFSAIVSMGMPAAKFIVEKLATGDVHVHWFPVLKDISHDDPVPIQDRGNIRAMTRHWIKWGKEVGLLKQ